VTDCLLSDDCDIMTGLATIELRLPTATEGMLLDAEVADPSTGCPAPIEPTWSTIGAGAGKLLGGAAAWDDTEPPTVTDGCR
jgi:hypothetical protein